MEQLTPTISFRDFIDLKLQESNLLLKLVDIIQKDMNIKILVFTDKYIKSPKRHKIEIYDQGNVGLQLEVAFKHLKNLLNKMPYYLKYIGK